MTKSAYPVVGSTLPRKVIKDAGYTIAKGDSGFRLVFVNDNPVTAVIPPGVWDQGPILFEQGGNGAVTFAAEPGVKLGGLENTLTSTGKFACGVLFPGIEQNSWTYFASAGASSGGGGVTVIPITTSASPITLKPDPAISGTIVYEVTSGATAGNEIIILQDYDGIFGTEWSRPDKVGTEVVVTLKAQTNGADVVLVKRKYAAATGGADADWYILDPTNLNFLGEVPFETGFALGSVGEYGKFPWQGDGFYLDNSTGENSATIENPRSPRITLTADTTYNVPGDFATAQAALDDLQNNYDGGGHAATVQTPDGTDVSGLNATADLVGFSSVTFLSNLGDRVIPQFAIRQNVGPPEADLPSELQGYSGDVNLLITAIDGGNGAVGIEAVSGGFGSALNITNFADNEPFALYLESHSSDNSSAIGLGAAAYAEADGGAPVAGYFVAGTHGFSNTGTAIAVASLTAVQIPTPQLNVAGDTAVTSFGTYTYDQTRAGIANIYYSWMDSRGVRRIKEDKTFDGVGQAIEALYNPQFTKYTPGASDYERIITGQWNGNVAEIGAEAGGTGTLRATRLLGSSILMAGRAVTTAQFDKTNDTTLANIPGLSVNVDVGTFAFEATLYTTSNVGTGVKAAVAGTCTASSFICEADTVAAGVVTQSRTTTKGNAVGGVTAVTAARIDIKGTIVVSVAGTLTVQFAENAGIAATISSVLVNSTFIVTRIS